VVIEDPVILSAAKSLPRLAVPPGVLVCLLLVSGAGCASPSAANNKLRAENLALQEQIDSLKRDRDVDRARIKALEQRTAPVPTLPQERLDKLVTVYGIKLGRLTGGDNWDADKPGDDGLKVVVQPVDRSGEKLKAAGSVVVDAFDLAAVDPNVGHWEFDSDQVAERWYGALLYSYVFKCPWQKKLPSHEELTVRVTFTDELTGRQFTEQRVCKVNLPSGGGGAATTQRVASP
jgi:hypothetical protein